MRGILGQSAALPCHVDQDNCGEIYVITISKQDRDDRWTRIYLYADNVEKPLSHLVGRASFSLNKNEAQLIINQLKSGDDSLYKVRLFIQTTVKFDKNQSASNLLFTKIHFF